MIKKVLYLPVRGIAMLAGFLIVLNLPSLVVFDTIKKSNQLNFSSFINNLIISLNSFKKMNGFSELQVYFQGQAIHMYLYTLSIFGTSLLIVSITGLLVSTTVIMFPKKIRTRIISLTEWATTVPELLIIFLLEYLVINLYKTYDIQLFKLYGLFGAEPRFSPIVVISFLPTIFLVQLMLKEFIIEETQDYVVFAKSKGLTYRTIYFKHILWNIFPLFLTHVRLIIWFLLTNVYVMEHLFYIKGFMLGMMNVYHPNIGLMNKFQTNIGIYIFGFLLFAIPIIIINGLITIVLIFLNRKEKRDL